MANVPSGLSSWVAPAGAGLAGTVVGGVDGGLAGADVGGAGGRAGGLAGVVGASGEDEITRLKRENAEMRGAMEPPTAAEDEITRLRRENEIMRDFLPGPPATTHAPPRPTPPARRPAALAVAATLRRSARELAAWTNSEVGGSGWREAMVPESGHVYYYNDQTGESSWVAPAGVGLTGAVVEGAGGLAGATGVGGAVALEVAAPRPTTQVLKSSASRDTRARWMNSNYVWANSQIGHNAPDEWSKPTEHKNDGASTVAQTDGGERLTAWKTRALEVTPLTHQIGGTAALSNDVSLVPAMGSGVSGGSGWRKAVVPESGHVYYYNDQTGESSWAIPIDYVPPNDQTGESTWDSTWDVPVDYVPPTPRRSVSGPTAPTALVASRRTSFRQRHRPRRRSSVEATRARQMWKKAGMMTRATVRFKSSGARPAKDSTRTVVGSVGIVARNPVDLGKSRATSSDWEELMDSTTGQKYYFSHERQEVSWTNPLFQVSQKQAGGGGARGATPTPEVAERTASSSGGRQISSEWKELVDDSTGEIYFYNRMMQLVSWTNPLVAVPGAQGGDWGSAPTVEEANRASKSRSAQKVASLGSSSRHMSREPSSESFARAPTRLSTRAAMRRSVSSRTSSGTLPTGSSTRAAMRRSVLSRTSSSAPTGALTRAAMQWSASSRATPSAPSGSSTRAAMHRSVSSRTSSGTLPTGSSTRAAMRRSVSSRTSSSTRPTGSLTRAAMQRSGTSGSAGMGLSRLLVERGVEQAGGLGASTLGEVTDDATGEEEAAKLDEVLALVDQGLVKRAVYDALVKESEARLREQQHAETITGKGGATAVAAPDRMHSAEKNMIRHGNTLYKGAGLQSRATRRRGRGPASKLSPRAKAATRHGGGSAPPRMYQGNGKTRQRSRSVPSIEGALRTHVPAQQAAVPRQASRQISSGGTSHLNNPVWVGATTARVLQTQDKRAPSEEKILLDATPSTVAGDGSVAVELATKTETPLRSPNSEFFVPPASKKVTLTSILRAEQRERHPSAKVYHLFITKDAQKKMKGIDNKHMSESERVHFMIKHWGAIDVSTDAETGNWLVAFSNAKIRDATEAWVRKCPDVLAGAVLRNSLRTSAVAGAVAVAVAGGSLRMEGGGSRNFGIPAADDAVEIVNPFAKTKRLRQRSASVPSFTPKNLDTFQEMDQTLHTLEEEDAKQPMMPKKKEKKKRKKGKKRKSAWSRSFFGNSKKEVSFRTQVVKFNRRRREVSRIPHSPSLLCRTPAGSVSMPKMVVAQKTASFRKASESMPTMMVHAPSPSSGPQEDQWVANPFSGAGSRSTQHKASKATRHGGDSAPPRMYHGNGKTRQRSRSVPSMEAGRITRQPRRGEEGALRAHVPAQQAAVPRQSSRQISSGGTSHLNNPVTQFLLDRASP